MSALLLALLLQAAPAHAPEAVPSPAATTTQAAEAPAPHAAADHPAAEAAGHGAEAGHGDPSTVIMHHVTDVPLKLGPVVLPSKHLVFFLLAMALVLAAVVAGVLLLGLPKLPLAFSLLSYFVLFLVMELTILHRRTTTPAVPSGAGATGR